MSRIKERFFTKAIHNLTANKHLDSKCLKLATFSWALVGFGPSEFTAAAPPPNDCSVFDLKVTYFQIPFLLFVYGGTFEYKMNSLVFSTSFSCLVTRGKNYTKHWFDERAVAVGMLACVPIGIVYPCAAVNYALGVMIPLHNYWYDLSINKQHSVSTYSIDPLIGRSSCFCLHNLLLCLETK